MGDYVGKHLSLQPGRVPPARVGNAMRLVHGLYSERVRAPIEEAFAEALREAMATRLESVYSDVLDEHAIRRAARALATVEMVETLIDEHGVESLGERAFTDYQRACAQADRWLDRLGMTPTSRAKLGVAVAKTLDIVEAMQRGRAKSDEGSDQ